MKNFLRFLAEVNSVGAGFERKTADMVQRWLRRNGLDRDFKATRYQTVSESGDGRDEDYSDVLVENLRTDERFFIECKEIDRSNVLNVQYDITDDGGLSPVKGKSRDALSENESGRIRTLTSAILDSDGFREFKEFLFSGNDWLNGEIPADYYFNRGKNADRLLPGLITAYNKAVKAGHVEADCKPFDGNKLRDSTKSMLVSALAWRLERPDRTWDICKIQNVPMFGEMVKSRYSREKAVPALYIQFGDKLFRTEQGRDPLGVPSVPVFPSDLRGNYAMKFTPRFGTGSIYVTPRSEITSEFNSPYSFVDREKWPPAENGKK